jgi:hypothetical protein
MQVLIALAESVGVTLAFAAIAVWITRMVSR